MHVYLFEELDIPQFQKLSLLSEMLMLPYLKIINKVSIQSLQIHKNVTLGCTIDWLLKMIIFSIRKKQTIIMLVNCKGKIFMYNIILFIYYGTKSN